MKSAGCSAAEKGPRYRSRSFAHLNVPRGYASVFNLPVALSWDKARLGAPGLGGEKVAFLSSPEKKTFQPQDLLARRWSSQ